MWIISLFKKRISLRDRFAMSAPPVPDWFEPLEEVTIQYPEVEYVYGKYSDHPLSYLMKYYNDELDDLFAGYPKEETDNINFLKSKIEHLYEQFQIKKLHNRLKNELDKMDRMSRWAYLYADAMINKRKTSTDYFFSMILNERLTNAKIHNL